MKNEQYNMSFTTGGLFFRESIEIAELFCQSSNWELVKQQALTSNILQVRKLSSAKRSLQEILKRLKNLSDAELSLLINGHTKEQKQLLWLAICKTYRFINEFAVEVVREKFLRLDMELSYIDFDIFFNNRAELDPNLEKLTETTRKKCRMVLFQIMREAEIITPDGLIIPAMLTEKLTGIISENNLEYLTTFPIMDSDLQRLIIP